MIIDYCTSAANVTDPCLMVAHGVPLYYIPYAFDKIIGPEIWWEDVITHQTTAVELIKKYWSLTIWIAVAYSIVIHIGQRYMSTRPAMELKWPLIIWNTGLAIFSLIGAFRMGEEFFYVLRTRTLLDSITYTFDVRQPAALWGTLFTFSKLAELVDTGFIVLRKKPLIFLHWYHHAIVLVYVFHAMKEGVAGARWFAFMNYCVHTIMYAYYAACAGGWRFPRAVSMSITTMQTTQMMIGVLISFIVFYYKLQGRIVQQSFENLFFCFGIYVSFAVLFSNFFYKTYLGQKKQKSKAL